MSKAFYKINYSLFTSPPSRPLCIYKDTSFESNGRLLNIKLCSSRSIFCLFHRSRTEKSNKEVTLNWNCCFVSYGFWFHLKLYFNFLLSLRRNEAFYYEVTKTSFLFIKKYVLLYLKCFSYVTRIIPS